MGTKNRIWVPIDAVEDPPQVLFPRLCMLICQMLFLLINLFPWLIVVSLNLVLKHQFLHKDSSSPHWPCSTLSDTCTWTNTKPRIAQVDDLTLKLTAQCLTWTYHAMYKTTTLSHTSRWLNSQVNCTIPHMNVSCNV
jgi:hypothetical protein